MGPKFYYLRLIKFSSRFIHNYEINIIKEKKNYEINMVKHVAQPRADSHLLLLLRHSYSVAKEKGCYILSFTKVLIVLLLSQTITSVSLCNGVFRAFNFWRSKEHLWGLHLAIFTLLSEFLSATWSGNQNILTYVRSHL